jgi:N-dimethylarginine dimethylaminohydrolase
MHPKNIYMCPPDYLSLKYEINPWMDKESEFSLSTAKKQWEKLFDLYKQLIPNNIFKVEAKEGLTELCFLGDSLFAINGSVVYSRFAKKERSSEAPYVMQYFSDTLEGKQIPEGMFYEGSGETMLWRDKIFVGYGQRSSVEIVSHLKSAFTLDVVGFELIDKKYYHLDTALFPINDHLIAVFPDAFSKKALDYLKSLDTEIIELNETDAEAFALNSVSIDNNIVVHYEAQNFINLLKSRSFNVHTVDISEFIKFGGGLKCLSFQHYLL